MFREESVVTWETLLVLMLIIDKTLMPYEVAQNRRNAFVKAGMAWRRELPPGEISHFARLLLNGTWLRDKVVALAKLNTRAWQGSVVSVFPDSISVFPGLPWFDFRISIES